MEGIFVPHVTPFTADGDPDIENLRVCVRFWLDGGVSGLVTCGSNGEAPYLSREERRRVIEAVVNEVDGRTPVIAGTGSMSTWETVAFTKDAEDLGADAALVIAPFYFKLSYREILQHYRTVGETVDLPLIIYNAPKFTGLSLEPNLIHQLTSKSENIVGVKESSGSIGAITEIVRLAGEKIAVLAGTADVALPTLLLGGRGAVIAVANVFPALCSKLYAAFQQGNLQKAAELQQQISFANEVLVKQHNQISAIKEALRVQGTPCGYPRRPVVPLDKDAQNSIQQLLKTMNSHQCMHGI